MYIEDAELRALYQTASTEHLQAIEAGLLALETNAQDTSPLDQLLREAHSLKGDSRMLGVTEAETLVHHFEEVLGQWRQGHLEPSPHVFEVLYRALDATKRVVHEAVTGEPAQVNGTAIATELLQLVGGTPVASPPPTAPGDTSNDQDELHELAALAVDNVDELDELIAAAATPIEPSAPNPVPPVTTASGVVEESGRIESVRIASTQLDALMASVGNLTVAQQRIAQQQQLIAESLTTWEQVQAQVLMSQRLLQPHPELVALRQHYDDLRQHFEDLGRSLQQLQTRAEVDEAYLTAVANTFENDIQNLQFFPLSTIFNVLPRLVRDIAKEQSKEVQLVIEGSEVRVDRTILEGMKDPLTHLVRNALDHGIEPPEERKARGKPRQATLIVRGSTNGQEVTIEVVDDGRGLDHEAIKRTALQRGLYSAEALATMSPSQVEALIFAPGFSTRTQVSTLSGRGVGLDVVQKKVEEHNGTIAVISTPGQGCRFQITLQPKRATLPILTVRLQDYIYGFPIEAIATTLLLSPQSLMTSGTQPTLLWEQRPIGIRWLAELLHQEASVRHRSQYPCVILRHGDRYQGLIVDEILNLQRVPLKPPHPLLQGVSHLLGVTVLDTGDICHLLKPNALMGTTATNELPLPSSLLNPPRKRRILLVEDSLPIRTQLRRILERTGYEVTTAVNGADGFQQLRTGIFDAIVSDVEMPQQNGIEMTQRIRQLPEYQRLPIVLVTTLAAAKDRERALAAGANAYLTKGNFDQTLLLQTLEELINEQN